MVRKAVRIFGISFALVALLVFSTTVVSDWDCHSSADDARCPYCHLVHQAPVEPTITQCASALEPVAYLPLPEGTSPAVIPSVSQTPPRAPPV